MALIVMTKDFSRVVLMGGDTGVDSVLGQDYRYTRAFVLDDGSTDHTTEILSGYADKATILKGGGGALTPGWDLGQSRQPH